MNLLQQSIKKEFQKIYKSLYEIDFNLDDIVLDVPPKKELGDFALASFTVSKAIKKSPIQIGQEIIDFVKINYDKNSVFYDFSLAGPYLNFKVDKLIIISLIKDYNFEQLNKNHDGKTIVIDYIGANVGKPLHIGHMCTPNQGQVMINLYKKLGFTVISDSHIGDWGIIFGRLIYAWKIFDYYFSSILSDAELSYYMNKYNTLENLKVNIETIKFEKLKSDGTDFLMHLYQKSFEFVDSSEYTSIEEEIRKEFKLLSEGNQESVELWQLFTRYSIDATQLQLNRLKIKPDYNIGESFYEGLGLPKMENYPDLKYDMKSIVKELVEIGIATKNDDGSVGVVFDEELKIPSCILQKRDGTHGYLASDLAAVKYRVENWKPEEIIYFVDVRQQLHLKQVFTIADKAGWISKDKLFHAYNGFISLKDGAMSTRKGRIIKLDKLLDEAELRARNIILEKRQDFTEEELYELSKIIGIGAIKYGYLSKNRTTDVVFDWDEFMTFEGNSGPYIQYAYVRARRILEKSGYIGNIENNKVTENYDDVKEKIKDELLELIKILVKYNSSDGILIEAAEKNMPHILTGYAYELTKSFNLFYNNVEVLGEKNEKIKKLLLKVTQDFSETIKDVFSILGIDMPEKM